MTDETEIVAQLKNHVLSCLQKRISGPTKPLGYLSQDRFDYLVMDAMESAAIADIIPDHLKLSYGMQVSQDQDLRQTANKLISGS
jgi:hypothetical protein